MACRRRLASVSFPFSSLTVAVSRLFLLLVVSSASHIVAPGRTNRRDGLLFAAEARDLPDRGLFGLQRVDREMQGRQSQGLSQVSQGSQGSSADASEGGESVARERTLLGIRPGSQGGQQTPEKCLKSTLPGFKAMIALADYAGLYFHFKVQGSTLNGALEARAVPRGGANKGWFAIGFSATGQMAGSDVVLGNYIPSTNNRFPVGPKPGGPIGPKPRPIAYLKTTGATNGNNSKSGNSTKSGGTKKKGGNGGGAAGRSKNSTKTGSTGGTGNTGNTGKNGAGNGGSKGKGPLVGAFNMKSLTIGTFDMAKNFVIANASVATNKNGTIVRFTRSGPGGSVPVKYSGINTFIWSYSSNGATKVFGGHLRHRGSVVVNLGCRV